MTSVHYVVAKTLHFSQFVPLQATAKAKVNIGKFMIKLRKAGVNPFLGSWLLEVVQGRTPSRGVLVAYWCIGK